MPGTNIVIPWKSLGTMDATAGAADGALGVAERTYRIANALDNSVSLYPIPIDIDNLEFRFKGGTNGHDCTMDVWVGKLCGDYDCELFRACTLVVEIGAQQSYGSASVLFADEITLSNEAWPGSDIEVVQSADASNLHARLIFPTKSNDLILFHGHTAFEGDCIVEYSGYRVP